eukprot:CFRG3340T1
MSTKTVEDTQEDAVADFEQCPKCFRTRTLHTNMKFMVTKCGHRICDMCMKRLLGGTGVGTCFVPGCSTTLRQNNFQDQIYEDTAVQSEVTVRQQIVAEFNKTQEDFNSLDEYNQYLEDVEDIIYNLVNKMDLDNTKAKIETNRIENKRLIQGNRTRKEEEARAIREQVKSEDQRKKMLWRQAFSEIDEEKLNKKRDQDRLMAQLAAVDPSRASDVIESFNRQKKQKVMREAIHKSTAPKTYAVKPRVAVPPTSTYTYTPLSFIGEGMAPGELEMVLQDTRLSANVITRASKPALALAGGHLDSYVAARGIQEARSCLI